MWCDIDGNNLTTIEVREILLRSVGTASAADHCKVGQIYMNGGIWFQRIS